jgi:hypothetical protein
MSEVPIMKTFKTLMIVLPLAVLLQVLPAQAGAGVPTPGLTPVPEAGVAVPPPAAMLLAGVGEAGAGGSRPRLERHDLDRHALGWPRFGGHDAGRGYPRIVVTPYYRAIDSPFLAFPYYDHTYFDYPYDYGWDGGYAWPSMVYPDHYRYPDLGLSPDQSGAYCGREGGKVVCYYPAGGDLLW